MAHSPHLAGFGRRHFLAAAGTGGLLLALGACGSNNPKQALSSSPKPPQPTVGRNRARETLVLRPAGDDLLLPAGFGYTVLTTSADGGISDGGMPLSPDGMGAFRMTDGTTRLVRNHERTDPPEVSVPLDAGNAYDPKASGGTTTLIVGSDNRSVVSAHVSLSGTLHNCSGGLTPWGTWLSCEESNEGAATGRTREHGYVFEVPAGAEGPVTPEPLVALGRFLHEAISVAADGTLYLTEDNGYDSGLYRFTPAVAERLDQGGRLEMLAVTDQPGYDTAYAQPDGVRLAGSWVPIADPDPASAGTDSSAVFNQGFDRGGARFKRLEGCCLVNETVFVTATEGGDEGLGQVWAYDIASSELHLVYESQAPRDLFGPDNLTAAPWTERVVVAEDNGNGDPNRLHLIGLDGQLLTFAENIADTTEFAGPCFSPDGSTLFVNVYGDEQERVPARTLAIWGPWETLTE